MKTKQITVNVTSHALDQWRKRAAEYGDDGPDSLIRAYLDSKPVDHPGGTRAKMPGKVYRKHPSGIVFAAESMGINVVRVVTVLPPEV